jgi:hypothetical protein
MASSAPAACLQDDTYPSCQLGMQLSGRCTGGRADRIRGGAHLAEAIRNGMRQGCNRIGSVTVPQQRRGVVRILRMPMDGARRYAARPSTSATSRQNDVRSCGIPYYLVQTLTSIVAQYHRAPAAICRGGPEHLPTTVRWSQTKAADQRPPTSRLSRSMNFDTAHPGFWVNRATPAGTPRLCHEFSTECRPTG